MSRTDGLKEYFNSLPEVIRIHELEAFIDGNDRINNAFNELKQIQKQLVNSKEYGLTNQYNILLKEYDAKREELLDLPFVEEYLELLEIVDQMLINLSKEIENKIDINRNENKL